MIYSISLKDNDFDRFLDNFKIGSDFEMKWGVDLEHTNIFTFMGISRIDGVLLIGGDIDFDIRRIPCEIDGLTENSASIKKEFMDILYNPFAPSVEDHLPNIKHIIRKLRLRKILVKINNNSSK